MQAGVAGTRMNWSDIFMASGLSLHLRAAVVRILVTVLLHRDGPNRKA